MGRVCGLPCPPPSPLLQAKLLKSNITGPYLHREDVTGVTLAQLGPHRKWWASFPLGFPRVPVHPLGQLSL
jgi:hypothetical protein